MTGNLWRECAPGRSNMHVGMNFAVKPIAVVEPKISGWVPIMLAAVKRGHLCPRWKDSTCPQLKRIVHDWSTGAALYIAFVSRRLRDYCSKNVG